MDLARARTAENNLSGEIPSEIQEFTELEMLDIYNNELVGMFPDSMIELESMTMLDAENNQLSGNPFTVLKNLRKLRNIRISNNLFVGELNDDSIENLEDLRELWIGGNRFQGELPGTIGNLKELGTFVARGFVSLVVHAYGFLNVDSPAVFLYCRNSLY